MLEEMLIEIKEYSNSGVNSSGVVEGSKMTSDSPNDNNPSNMANGGKRPIFTITPATNLGYTDVPPNGSPRDIVIGLQGSDSTPKLQINGMRSRDSRESLIPEEHKERWYTILAQVCIPFLIAGLGMVGAGLILDVVKVTPL